MRYCSFSKCSNLQTDIRSRIVELFDERNIKHFSVDLVRFSWVKENGDDGDEEEDGDNEDGWDDVGHLPGCYLTIDRSVGDEVNADCMLHDMMQGCPYRPSVNLLQANSRTLPTVPRPPVDLHIYFIAYERAAHTLMTFFSAPCRRMFRLSGT